MPPALNLVGQRFGKLVVKERTSNLVRDYTSYAQWVCLCDCGNQCVKISNSLVRSKDGKGSTSCGCTKYKHKTKTKYIGVCVSPPNRFIAVFKLNYREYYLGSFVTAIEAAMAYDKKAVELLGDKAVLNFPDKPEEGEETFIGAVDVQPEDRWQ